MGVRAKFYVSELRKNLNADGGHVSSYVVLSAVSGQQNKTWAQYTPCGKVELSIDNPAALEQFELGKHYFLDFSTAPATEAEEKR